MGNLIGVLSTVILVSTVCTLIFAVGAYVVSRKGRNGVGTLDETDIPGTDVADQFPGTAMGPATQLFKRVQPMSSDGGSVVQTSVVDEEYAWK